MMLSSPAPFLGAVSGASHAMPPLWTVLPFGALLLCIALMPLLAARFWQHHYAKVAVSLGLITAAYYLLCRPNAHLVPHALTEYVNFMALIGSLYVISGGINIQVKGEATPVTNVVFLL